MKHLNTTITITTDLEDWLNTLAKSLNVAKIWSIYRYPAIVSDYKVEFIKDNKQNYILKRFRRTWDYSWEEIDSCIVTEQEKEHLDWLKSVAIYLVTNNYNKNVDDTVEI